MDYSSSANEDLYTKFTVSREHGFLIAQPKDHLPSVFSAFVNLASRDTLADQVARKTFRESIDELNVDADVAGFNEVIEHMQRNELYLLHMVLTFLTSGYVWQEYDEYPKQRLPACLSVPLWLTSEKLGIKPVISYPSMVLANWAIKDPSKHFDIENIRTIYNPPGGEGTEWFILVHVITEHHFGPIIEAVINICSVKDHGFGVSIEEKIMECLCVILSVIKQMKQDLKRLDDREHLVPVKYYHRIRHFFAGWDRGTLKDGLIFDGISETPIKLSGGSAAQSSTLQTLDAILGIEHGKAQQEFLQKAQEFMLPEHKEFIKYLQQNCNLREYAITYHDSSLRSKFNACVAALSGYRRNHMKIVETFIVKPALEDSADENKSMQNFGAGGTPFVEFLSAICRSTTNAKL